MTSVMEEPPLHWGLGGRSQKTRPTEGVSAPIASWACLPRGPSLS